MGNGDRQPGKRAQFADQYSPQQVESWLKAEFGKTEFQVYGLEPPAYPQNFTFCEDYSNVKIHHLDQLPRFWGTWWRVREAYRIAKDFEKRMGWNFDAMFRVRPDFAFLKESKVDILKAAIERDKNARVRRFITPPSSFVRGQNLNDWGAACERTSCESYFDLISLWENCTSDLCCWGWGPFYDKAMELTSTIATDSFDVLPVTLVRKEFVACNRIDEYARKDPTLLQGCYDLAQSLGVRAAYNVTSKGSSPSIVAAPPPDAARRELNDASCLQVSFFD
eukprot:CAMPEP_0184494210 /NCGR_PEP_ID=MMETSP0113_2-20130426/28130_1 /TAXON_ID=91329 /ORGANISM="Norrisiella sphaerica, Strain BC52" /LENGTH=278 /DNA_ID=CAMNT_0026879865 /DNA_START=630 /DNA_END=1467 /DNA_ORIENTATION=+